MSALNDLRHAVHTLLLTYDLLGRQDAPPVMIYRAARDAREAMRRLQIAHENYIKAIEAREKKNK